MKKTLQVLNSIVQAVTVIVLMSVALSMVLGVPVLLTASILLAFVVLFTALRVIGFSFCTHILCAGVYREIWTGEVIKRLSHADTANFLEGIPDKSRYVTGDDEVQVINMAMFGATPDVLINNTTYPIDIQNLGDDNKAITLDKFQTKATPVTDDELHAISYPRIQAVTDSHGDSIAEKKHDKAVHALAPGTNTASTPILLTTGADDGTGRLRLRKADVVNFKTALDKAKVYVTGRRLVLCPDHVNDLLMEDQKFMDQYYNWQTGMISRTLGFDMYQYLNNPYFTPATRVKKSFGAVPAGTDRMASVFFCPSRTAMAMGKTKMYWSKAETDPLNQRNLINFRHYYIVLPVAGDCIGAIVSANAS